MIDIMKKAAALVVVLSVCAFSICGCVGSAVKEEKNMPGVTGRTQPTELIVFAAASMTETMEEIGKAYMEKNPDIVITYTFDSSGTLKTQIEEGADCDIFISAASKQMDQLDITADEEIGDGSRFPRFPKTNHGSGSQGTCPRDS